MQSTHNLPALFLTLTVSEFRQIKRTVRTLGSLGVTDFDYLLEQIVLGLHRKREDIRQARDERTRQHWAAR